MQPAEKQEFIQYLEKGGVIDVLTKTFVSLYEQNNSGGRTDDPMEFLKNACVGGDNKISNDLEKENEELKQKIKELEQELEKTKQSKSE